MVNVPDKIGARKYVGPYKAGGFQQGDSCFSKLMSDVAQHLLGVVLM